MNRWIEKIKPPAKDPQMIRYVIKIKWKNQMQQEDRRQRQTTDRQTDRMEGR